MGHVCCSIRAVSNWCPFSFPVSVISLSVNYPDITTMLPLFLSRTLTKTCMAHKLGYLALGLFFSELLRGSSCSRTHVCVTTTLYHTAGWRLPLYITWQISHGRYHMADITWQTTTLNHTAGWRLPLYITWQISHGRYHMADYHSLSHGRLKATTLYHMADITWQTTTLYHTAGWRLPLYITWQISHGRLPLFITRQVEGYHSISHGRYHMADYHSLSHGRLKATRLQMTAP